MSQKSRTIRKLFRNTFCQHRLRQTKMKFTFTWVEVTETIYSLKIFFDFLPHILNSRKLLLSIDEKSWQKMVLRCYLKFCLWDRKNLNFRFCSIIFWKKGPQFAIDGPFTEKIFFAQNKRENHNYFSNFVKYRIQMVF